MRLLTGGESHGLAQCAILEGFPKGVEIDLDRINEELLRRQKGYGRGGRMKIEADTITIVSGMRRGITLGSPIAMLVKNKDHTVFATSVDTLEALSVPRPAHADLAGFLKYNEPDMRNILERASARETVMRVCAGSICKQFLDDFDITIASFVVSIGPVSSTMQPSTMKEIVNKTSRSQISAIDGTFEKKAIAEIDRAARRGDSLGGIIEVWAENVPPGLGSVMHYDRRLDTKIAAGIMSIPAIKGVEIGLGFEYARRRGSQTHDVIRPARTKKSRFRRDTNNAGGIEGGMSNGETIIIRCAMKPISTLGHPLDSVDVLTKHKKKAPPVRSDVCAVSACGVVAESMLALVLTESFLEKFGSDTQKEITQNYQQYLRRIIK
ncbi:MAG: chorismate synthase [Candidatus Omnitrophica bacterium]|nr:chorismate synthase [Candidatus Omnitrophota bacterium]